MVSSSWAVLPFGLCVRCLRSVRAIVRLVGCVDPAGGPVTGFFLEYRDLPTIAPRSRGRPQGRTAGAGGAEQSKAEHVTKAQARDSMEP